MRLDNLSKGDKEKARVEPYFLLQVLEDEYEAIKEDLVELPLEHIPKLRGKASVLKSLIKLLS